MIVWWRRVILSHHDHAGYSHQVFSTTSHSEASVLPPSNDKYCRYRTLRYRTHKTGGCCGNCIFVALCLFVDMEAETRCCCHHGRQDVKHQEELF